MDPLLLTALLQAPASRHTWPLFLGVPSFAMTERLGTRCGVPGMAVGSETGPCALEPAPV